MVNRKKFLYISGFVRNFHCRSAGRGALQRRSMRVARRVGAAPGQYSEAKVPPLFDILLSRMALHAVSIVLGGIGMFCLFMSFVAPGLAAQAFVLIAAAGAIVYFCGE
jgi:multisubunit Na+/H+ antiporter MnhB subunit